jgi:hypothetical protein
MNEPAARQFEGQSIQPSQPGHQSTNQPCCLGMMMMMVVVKDEGCSGTSGGLQLWQDERGKAHGSNSAGKQPRRGWSSEAIAKAVNARGEEKRLNATGKFKKKNTEKGGEGAE